MGKIIRKLSRIGLMGDKIWVIIKTLLLLSYYLIIHPLLIILAINYLFPHTIALKFLNILVVSFIYNMITEKVKIRFNS
jgi:hypothetical protein